MNVLPVFYFDDTPSSYLIAKAVDEDCLGIMKDGVRQSQVEIESFGDLELSTFEAFIVKSEAAILLSSKTDPSKKFYLLRDKKTEKWNQIMMSSTEDTSPPRIAFNDLGNIYVVESPCHDGNIVIHVYDPVSGLWWVYGDQSLAS